MKKQFNDMVIVDDLNLRNQIIKTISSIAGIDGKKFNENTLIREELGIDSLMTIEIIAKIEKYYNIQINEEDIIDIDNVGGFINFIETIIADK
ncbi:acyl carrier protein [Desulfotignum balticum]|jgi:acyl carrier protein|uniref:acyl carrier protein n=1 Tax=Desulfotignum balticum TaxID=115781 RepID=UPI00040E20E6|nr:acyl carrier protein [Desulfotignum balticum]